MGAYLATSITEQLRLSYIINDYNTLPMTVRWYLLMGVAMGPICLWSTHITGLTAITFYDAHGDRLTMHFDQGVTMGSFVVVFCCYVVGMFISSFDSMYLKTKTELIEEYIPGARDLSLIQLRKLKNKKLVWIICTQRLGYLFCGGLVSSTGALFMHYFGMESLHFGGHFHWIPEITILSVLITVFVCMLSNWVTFRFLSLFPYREDWRVLCSIAMALGSCAIHYVGMMAGQGEMGTHKSSFVRKTRDAVMLSRMDTFHRVTIASLCMAAISVMCVLGVLRGHSNKFLVKMKPQLRRSRVIKAADLLTALAGNLALRALIPRSFSKQLTTIAIEPPSASSYTHQTLSTVSMEPSTSLFSRQDPLTQRSLGQVVQSSGGTLEDIEDNSINTIRDDAVLPFNAP